MSHTLTSTPKADGYWMPAEWHPHKQTWMHWPERTDTWRLGVKPAQIAYARVAKAIAEFEPVTVCASARQLDNARAMLQHPNIRVIELPQDDAWMRDSGPTFVINGKGGLRGIDWKFNAYGGTYNGLYSPWDKDDLVARKILEMEGYDRYRTGDFVMEGGSIHTDGEGTGMICAEPFMCPGRNPTLKREEMEKYLKEYMNVEKVLWVPRGIFNDETGGHIDNMAFFCRPAEVVLAWTEDKNDPQYERSVEAYEYLTSQTDAKGRSITVHKLPIPAPIITTEEDCLGLDCSETAKDRIAGDRLAGSYINCLICNKGLILPAYGDPNDDVAADILQKLMPDHKVVQVDTREILLGGGNIHCITQQEPLPT